MSLASVGNGAAFEKFEAEIQKVLDNIRDPNTDPKAKREITLKFSFKPDLTRESAVVEIASSVKLCSDAPHNTKMYIANDNGRPLALQADEQIPLFPKPENVKEIKAAKGGDE